jgi:isocitrate dehydrogenase
VRPVKYYSGVPSPVKHPERMDVVIFRENTEDVYAGVEWEEGTPECARLIEFLNKDMLKGGKKQIRLDSGIGIKPISVTGTKRLVRMAIQHALESAVRLLRSCTRATSRNSPKAPSRKWGYEIAIEQFRDKVVTERESWILDNKDKNPNLSGAQNAEMIEPGMEFAPPAFRQSVEKEVKDVLDAIYSTHGNGAWKKKIMINDRIADSIFQQIVTRPEEYSVLATPNLNGDYISDAAAAQVGGLGIAPGANIGDGYAIFEATHGTAPKYADKDVINPGSVILSGVMMFRHLRWNEAADLIEQSMERTIEQKKVTYDFERLMPGATKVKTSEFAGHMIENMGAGVLV